MTLFEKMRNQAGMNANKVAVVAWCCRVKELER